MSYSEPARAQRRGPPTVYRTRRRGGLLGTLAVLLLGYATFSAAEHFPIGNGRSRDVPGRVVNNPAWLLNKNRTAQPTVSWPQSGQAAFVLGDRRPSASPNQQPAPIASLAKVMTAYLTLERYPLDGQQEGFTITVSAADAEAAAEDIARNQSVVAVQPGEQLTERQLLEAMLIPSGNNIASLLAGAVAGSEARFLDEMNAAAGALGMNHTIYTDPSGFDPGTISTAADQLRVFRHAMRFPAFRQVVSMANVTLPVAGTLTNFNPLVADGFAGKTGSDAAAGGCLAFFTHVRVAGQPLTAIGVVMGQGEGSDTKVILAAAGEAAQQMVDSVGAVSGVPSRGAPDAPARQ